VSTCAVRMEIAAHKVVADEDEEAEIDTKAPESGTTVESPRSCPDGERVRDRRSGGGGVAREAGASHSGA